MTVRRGGAAIGLLAAAAIALTGCSSAPHHVARPAPAATYGSMPTYLPKSTVRADSMLVGRPGRPAVTSEGDRVLARYGGGSVQVQVVGPVVPGEGLPYVADATTATWTVSFGHGTVPVPIRLKDFLAVDEEGHPYAVQARLGKTLVEVLKG